jgi:hypothetical protein
MTESKEPPEKVLELAVPQEGIERRIEAHWENRTTLRFKRELALTAIDHR